MKTPVIAITIFLCVCFGKNLCAQAAQDSIARRNKLRTLLQENTKELAALLNDCKRSKKIVDSLSKEVDKIQQEITLLKAQKAGSQSKITALKADLAKKELLLEKQNGIFDKQLDELDSLTQVNTRLGDTYDSLYLKKHF